MEIYKNELFQLGYCVVPQVLAQDHIDSLRNIYLRTFADSNLVTLKPSEFLKNEAIADIIFNPQVIKTIETIIGKEFCIYPDFTIRKSLYIPWHTDTAYLSIKDTDDDEHSDMVQMSIYLQNNALESGGGLEIIPGSHRQKNLNRQNLMANEIDFNQAKLMPSMAGDLVFWDSRLIHRSSHANINKETKLALQWTISRTEKFSLHYLNYLNDRILAKQKHVSDNVGTRESDYLLGIKEVKFPESFSPHQNQMIINNKIKIKTV